MEWTAAAKLTAGPAHSTLISSLSSLFLMGELVKEKRIDGGCGKRVKWSLWIDWFLSSSLGGYGRGEARTAPQREENKRNQSLNKRNGAQAAPANQLKKFLNFFIDCGRQWNSWSCWLGLLSLLPAAVMGWLASQGLRQREDKPTQTTNNKWMELKEEKRVKSTKQRQAAIQRNQFIDWIWMERQLVGLIERCGREQELRPAEWPMRNLRNEWS